MTAQDTGDNVRLDANGNATLLVPTGITPSRPSIRLDNQPPVVTGPPDRPANANGWYNAPVTITWSSRDPSPSSGTPTTPAPTTVSTDGASQVITSARSCDPAGNCATGSYTVSIDQAPPSISASVQPAANQAGWYTADPTIHYTCSDAVSGIASCPDDHNLTSDGADQVITGTATDNAGNTASTTTTLNVDTTPPVVSVTGPSDGGHYLQGHAPAPGCATTDATSGVATEASLTVTGHGGGSYTATCAGATDNVGNTAGPVSVSYSITTPPVTAITISPAAPDGSNGWYVTALQVTVSATDPTSAVADTRCELDPASPPAGFAQLPAGCPYTGTGAAITTDGPHTPRTTSASAASAP